MKPSILGLWVVLIWLFITAFVNSSIVPENEHLPRRTSLEKNPGFISIDCGVAHSYTDPNSSIWYEADTNFVETGTNYNISPSAQLDDEPYFGTQLKTLRSFPDGERNCYTLKPEQGKGHKYLIRAYFQYGNYDNKSQTPVFDIYLGVNFWKTISFSNEYQTHYYPEEMIYVPKMDNIIVCLVNTGKGIPVISTLELRPLNNSIYQVPSNLLPLNLRSRRNLGTNTSYQRLRYKDDVYDRIWFIPADSSNWSSPISTMAEIANRGAYKLPIQVLTTAAQPLNLSNSLDYKMTWTPNLGRTYYFYFHFAEIQELTQGQKRIISDVMVDDLSILSDPVTLEYLEPLTITSGPIVATQKSPFHFKISAATGSGFPPILNAFEVYELVEQPLSATYAGDADAILDIKHTYKISRIDWQGDPCTPKQYKWDGVNCSSYQTPRIISLDMSTSQLEGQITHSFSSLTNLESLDLSYNNLEGPLPEYLGELPNLKFLNLEENKLSGKVPKALQEKSEKALELRLSGNPSLCLSSDCTKKRRFLVPVLVSSMSVLIVIIFICMLFIRHKRRRIRANQLEHGFLTIEGFESKKQQFTYSELQSITKNFARVVGKGGIGTVYHGYLADKEVAVKMLSPSAHGYKQFQAEAKLLSRIHHRCLTSFVGYCYEGPNMALLYEYMPQGNLANHLSDADDNDAVLGWGERLQIAMDVAIGLEYLHNGCKPPIVHRDIKSTNILLNEKYQAKIADFGLSRIFANEGDTHVSTRIAGTPGYVDPEYYILNKLNEKSDVFSFGVVLLEIITGRPAISKTKEKTHVIEWVHSVLEEGEIKDIVDPRLEGEFDSDPVQMMVDIAMACVAPRSYSRPAISQVVIELKHCFPVSDMALKCDSDERYSRSLPETALMDASSEESLAR